MVNRQWGDNQFGALPSVLVAAHELKAPLALVRQISLLLEEGSLDEASVRVYQQQITQTSERALALTTDLAHVANLSPSLFPLEPVNPLALCRKMASELRPMLRLYNRTVQWPQRSQTQLVVANHTLLSRILANFLDNALRYSEEDTIIQFSVKRTGALVRVAIRDFGPMLSHKEYSQLLREMETRKSMRTRPESSGLGVYVASQFARAMHGSIGLIRHRDGLTFYVDIPVSQQMSFI